MKILIVSYSGYGAFFSLRFLDEGHKVDYYLLEKKYAKVLEGIAPSPIFKKPDFSKYDLVLFDLTGKPALAEEAMKSAPTLGDSNIADMLEDDRMFGIQVMEQCGIKVPPYETFSDIETARRYVEATKKRYVFKPNGGQEQETASTYVSTDYQDLLKYFDRLAEMSHGVEFLLQEVVNGTEISTEGYFNGEDFYLINGTLEEKKFMDKGRGPNTGCSGNLVWPYRQAPQVYKQGLELMKPFLQESGYVGMIDLNTIATPGELYGLEWTPRFGYDATATLFHQIGSDLGEFLYSIATGTTPNISFLGEFSAGVRLSIPPYPNECEEYYHEGVPIQGIEPEDLMGNYVYDVMINEEDELVSAGAGGLICVPMGYGDTIEAAFSKVHDKIKRIRIPNMQYRNDIYKCTKERYDILSRQGWLR